MVSRCDLMVGIYARRYGTRDQHTGTSITESEYNAASKLGLPRLCFVLSDDAEWPVHWLSQGEDAEAMRMFKERVRSEVIVREFNDLPGLLEGVGAAADEYAQTERRRWIIRLVLTALAVVTSVVAAAAAILRTATYPVLTADRAQVMQSVSGLTRVASHPATNALAVAFWDGSILAWPDGDFRKQPVKLGRVGNIVWDLAFSQDGKQVITAGAGGVVSWGWDGVERWRVPQPEGNDARSIAVGGSRGEIVVGLWSGQLALISPDGLLERMYGAAAQQTGLPEDDFGAADRVAYAPNTRAVAVGFIKRAVCVLDLATGRFRVAPVADKRFTRAGALDYSRSGDLYVLYQRRNTPGFVLVRLRQDGLLQEVGKSEGDSTAQHIVLTESDRHVVTADWGGEVTLWDTVRGAKLAGAVFEWDLATAHENDRELAGLVWLPKQRSLVAINHRQLLRFHLEWRSVGGRRVPWEGSSIW